MIMSEYCINSIDAFGTKPFLWRNHPFFKIKEEGRPLIIAHRGDSSNAPENTLLAFYLALIGGSDVIEIDLKLTRDSKIVVLHDHKVNRVTDGRGYIRDYTLDELKKLDAGFRFKLGDNKVYPYRGKGLTIPTLEEVIFNFGSTRFLLDLHSGGKEMAEELAKLIIRYRIYHRVLIVAESIFTLRWLQNKVPECAFGVSIIDALSFGFAAELRLPYKPMTDSIQFPSMWRGLQTINQAQVSLARSKGLQFHVFTVNEREYMRKLINMGVDGIITDKPRVLREILDKTSENK